MAQLRQIIKYFNKLKITLQMSSIETLGISGIRGYSPQDYQRIEFMKPLTLIWGKNGSGKTTIIECLKYITTGALPPNSDKGKSFIMDTKVAGKPEVIGDIRFIFKVGNRAILAKRRIQLSAKGQQLKFQSIEQVLKTKGQNGQDLTINHQCAQIEKQVPQFLGISKPILENIVFCHQDESLWPFGDSLLLKNIFDELFQTKRITKQMQKIWEVIKFQQTQLKEQKIRLEYQKSSFKKQLEDRSRYFLQLQEIELKSRQLKQTKKTIKKLKQSLKDNTEKIKQRQKLIYRKGKIQNSITNSQTKLRTLKQNVYRIEKQLESKLKGRQSDVVVQQNSYGIVSSRTHSIGSFHDLSMPKISQSQLQKVKLIPIQTPERSIQQLQFKKSVYDSLKQKYKQAKQQHDNIRNFTESSKREQEIKSEIQRIKSLVPELKYNINIKNDEDFLRLLKSYITEMQSKIKGKQIAKKKLEKIDVPAIVEIGFSDKQIQQLKKQIKHLQSEIKFSSLTILKVYQAQYKTIPSGLPIQRLISQFQTLEKDVYNTEAILKSKQQELQQYIQLQQNQLLKDKKTLQNNYNHYKYAGIQLQQEMLHFCQKKGKCYFCEKEMTKKEIEQARQKVNLTKKKAEMRLKEIQNQMQNQGEIIIDPEVMVKKLTEQVSKLNNKLHTLREKFSKLKQAKQYEKQIQLNNSLSREMDKCNLHIDMLQRLSASHNTQTDQQYKDVTIEKFVQMCSQHQIGMTRYKAIKDQISKLETNQQKNQLNKVKREQIIKDKRQLQQQIAKTEEQVRHFEFLKNSLQKLEPLIKMQIKSKQKKSVKQGKNGQNSSSQASFFSVQQAAHAMNRLYMQILQEKVYIQKLQISINYHNDKKYLEEQKQQYHEVIKQLERLTNQLKTSQETLNKYNTIKTIYEKQTQRIKVRMVAISQYINQPMQSTYLSTLTKIKHLQASIKNLQLLYYLMQDSVSKYHSQKMQQINQYIYQVWRQIYHGEDIDYIQIQASSDDKSKKKKKNYHYRILMKKSTKNFKNQQKVQMKGRCSTGQKVLASIVIRLALAEVFCSNTRILALDQPTTNLDSEHIRNLANALLRLIQISGGRNLQLIIISHDIEFIQLLESYAEYYYEVKRDQNRFSTISKKLIRQILRDPKPVS